MSRVRRWLAKVRVTDVINSPEPNVITNQHDGNTNEVPSGGGGLSCIGADRISER